MEGPVLSALNCTVDYLTHQMRKPHMYVLCTHASHAVNINKEGSVGALLWFQTAWVKSQLCHLPAV